MFERHTLVAPMFIGKAKISANSEAALHMGPLAPAIMSCSSATKSNLRRLLTASWVAESLKKSGQRVHLGFFEGWKAHSWKYRESYSKELHPRRAELEKDTPPVLHHDTVTGSEFMKRLLEILQNRGEIDVDPKECIVDPQSRCTLQEVRAIRSKAMELFAGENGEKNVEVITDDFSPAPWRAEKKFQSEFAGTGISVSVHDIESALEQHNVPMNEYRNCLLSTTDQSRIQWLKQMALEYTINTGVHVVSEIQRKMGLAPQGYEAEGLLAKALRRDKA